MLNLKEIAHELKGIRKELELSNKHKQLELVERIDVEVNKDTLVEIMDEYLDRHKRIKGKFR